jgi:acyl-CoA reductase-like NAD-dependent aldehyde dehydrogenase
MEERHLEEIIQKMLLGLDKGANVVSNKDGNQGVIGSAYGIFDTIDEAVLAARHAFLDLNSQTLELRKLLVTAIREKSRLHAHELAKMARDETQFGDIESKCIKNILVSEKTPGYEIIKPMAMSGDRGLTVIEHAPYGVIASITPSTNPTATIINNTISMLAAGNSVVFNVHPRAKNVSIKTVELLNKAIVNAGGPQNLVTCIYEPTVESAQYLMQHSDIDLLLVTGGPSVVEVAMRSGKRAICAGPGNPPVVVDATADILAAAKDIVLGASFDHNLPCTCEKEIIVVEQVADQLKNALSLTGALEIKGESIERLEAAIFSQRGSPFGHGLMNPNLIGQSAVDILQEIGISVDSEVKMILVETGPDHPLIWSEQMMPVLPIIRVRNFNEAVDLAKQAEQNYRHTAGIHSLDIRNLSYMAKVINTSLFIKNGPFYSGLGYQSEGYSSFSIGTFTREGLTTAKSFTWERKCALVDYFHIV